MFRYKNKLITKNINFRLSGQKIESESQTKNT